ncbi:response regulator transcription factor [Micromonospora sp. CPCC 205371]|nr:response regulator transcription factor [Micromonospora sp. CPCC 205371]
MGLRLLLADDQAVVRAGFRTILGAEAGLSGVGGAGGGTQGVGVAPPPRPDLVLMDIRMPGLDGIRATEKLAGEQVVDPVTVLAVTTFDLDEYVFGALRAGASGFLLKDVEPDELVAAVRTVAGGQGLVSPRVTRRLIAEFARSCRPQPPDRLLATLTERERETLDLVARGLSNMEIAERMMLGAATVKTHVSSLLAKLGCRDRVQLVVFAYEHGIIEPGRPGY